MIIKFPKYTGLLALVLLFSLGAGTGSATVLNVQQHYQEQDQWCWAASSQAILEFYRTNKTQTEIAQYGTDGQNIWNWIWGSSTDPIRNGINLILFHFAKLATTHYSSSLLEAAVQTEINALKPFVVRWEWDSGGGHFVVARGIEGGNMYLMDPWNGPTINTYSWVCRGSTHTWTDTLTLDKRPAFIGSAIINLLLQ
jgi:hypothetical protein